jgi:hypothetical protein
MATTYLDLVNSVLVRLREKQVTTVNQTPYSTLVGAFVNDAKREVEDAWNWDVLRNTFSFNTTQGTVSYSLSGAGDKARIIVAYNDTHDVFLDYRPSAYFTQQLLFVSPQEGPPAYYNPNGVDTNGDMIVDVLPVPDSTVYTCRFDLVVPELELTTDSSQTKLPKNPIVLLAWAKAIEERGEDGGVGVSSQYAVAKQALGDAIAIEAGRRPDEINWAWI